MDDIDQMEWNEYQRLERAIEARRKRIEALEKGSPLVRQRNFRYVVDFNFDYTEMAGLIEGIDPFVGVFPGVAPPSPQTRSFIVKSEAEAQRKTCFYVKSIEASYAVLASQQFIPTPEPPAPSEGPGQRFFVGPDYRRNFFDFTWRIRDTGSDREWQNTSLPSQLLVTGNVNPLLFGNGHCMLSGGTEVLVEITPTFSGNLLSEASGEFTVLPPLTAFKSHALQVCFVGVEVLL
jgi:hypothetical protein